MKSRHLVLIPEMLEALQPYGGIPILAAGGIVMGRGKLTAMME